MLNKPIIKRLLAKYLTLINRTDCIGFIDCVSNGHISGWVHSQSFPNKNIEYLIALDGKVILQSVAMVFRDDLLNAGIGNGMHGYCIKHNLTKNELIGKSLQLLDTSNRNIGNPFPIKLSDTLPQNHSSQCEQQNLAEIKNITVFNHLVIFDFYITTGKTTTVQLFSDNKPFYQENITLKSGSNQMAVSIPFELMTDSCHIISIGVIDELESIWEGGLYIPLLSNDLQWNLEKSSSLITPQNAINRARLESLELQRRLSNVNLESVETAYNLLNSDSSVVSKVTQLHLPDNQLAKIAIILNPNLSYPSYIKCIASLLLSDNRVIYSIYIISDKGSNCWNKLKTNVKNIKLVAIHPSVSYSEKLSICIEQVSEQYTLFMNDAVDITSYFIDRMLASLEINNAVAVIGKLIDKNLECCEIGLQEQSGDYDYDYDSDNMFVKQIGHPANAFVKDIEFFTRTPVIFATTIILELIQSAKQNQLNGKMIEGASDYSNKLSEQIVTLGRKIRYQPSAECFDTHSLAVIRNERIDGFHNKYLIRNAKRLKQTNKSTIIMIDRMTPKPDIDAGSYAAIQEIKLLLSLGFHIVFIPDEFVYSPKYTAQLQQLGVEVLYHPYYISSKSALIEYLPFTTAVYITRYQNVEKYIETIKLKHNDIPILFNNADLHFLRESRRAISLNDKEMLKQSEVTKKREIKVMQQVDAILSYNECEHTIIASHITNSDKIFKTPWVIEEKTSGLPFSDRDGIAFLGGYDHMSNVDAFHYFVVKVMPLLIEKDSQIRCYFYGSNMPESFKQYENKNIILIGYVESLDDVYLKHRVFVAPLLSGAGVKGKVLESAAYGLPCVLSPVAIEGTGLVHNVSALVAETNDEWVSSIASLYYNEKQWADISDKQKKLAYSTYSFDVAKQMMRNIMTSVKVECS